MLQSLNTSLFDEEQYTECINSWILNGIIYFKYFIYNRYTIFYLVGNPLLFQNLGWHFAKMSINYSLNIQGYKVFLENINRKIRFWNFEARISPCLLTYPGCLRSPTINMQLNIYYIITTVKHAIWFVNGRAGSDNPAREILNRNSCT
jgi:hypothetical protein